MSRNTFLNVLFLTASLISVSADAVLYRIAVVLILTGLRLIWMRATIKRSRDDVINEINQRRRVHASQKANPSTNGLYQGDFPPQHESLSR